MVSEEKRKWDARYRENKIVHTEAASVLAENRHLLPRSGVALDLACGIGANARLLASHGLTTSAWDISTEALEHVQRLCS